MKRCRNRRWLLALSAVTALGSGLARGDDQSLANYVSAETGLFVEARGLDDLLLSLTEPQVWLALAELAGQPAKMEEAEEWRNRIRQTVKMEPAEAIHVLFSQRVAFCGEGLGKSQDAIVLCKPAPNTAISDLLKKWEAQPLGGGAPPNAYRLRNNVGLATHDGLLVFGDPVSPSSLFRRTLASAAATRPAILAEDAVYRRLLARVPENPDGVLFARLGHPRLVVPPAMPLTSAPVAEPATQASASASQPTSQSTSAPASLTISDLPGPLRDSANVLLALHRQDRFLHFSAVGDAGVRSKPPHAPLTPLVATLPERTLFAWGGSVDYPALARTIELLPERNAIRIGYKLLEKRQTAQRLLTGLDTSTCIAVGLVTPEHRQVAAPPVPALAILMTVRQPEAIAAEFAELVKSSVSLYNLLSLSRGLPHLEAVSDEPCENTIIHVLDLSEALQKIDNGAVGEWHLCWALDGDVLLVASHVDWLRQILASRHGTGPGLREVLKLAQRPVSADTETIFVVQSGPIADLGALWLKYLEKTRPEILKEDWWRKRQLGGPDMRLGVTVTENGEKKALRVDTIAPGQPADGALRVGDEIIGDQATDGSVRKFATTQPVREVQQRIAQRPNARWIDLAVRRGDAVLFPRVPLPFIDPVLLLRRTVSIGKLAQRVVYFDDVPDAAGPRGFLTVELRKSAEPLFDLEPKAVPQLVGPPTSEPASQPTSQPAPSSAIP